MEDDGCNKADTYLGRKSHCCLLGGWNGEGHRIVIDQCPFYPEYFDDCIAGMAIHTFEAWLRRHRAKQWLDEGHTLQEIAEWLDVSRGTVNRYLRRENVVSSNY